MAKHTAQQIPAKLDRRARAAAGSRFPVTIQARVAQRHWAAVLLVAEQFDVGASEALRMILEEKLDQLGVEDRQLLDRWSIEPDPEWAAKHGSTDD